MKRTFYIGFGLVGIVALAIAVNPELVHGGGQPGFGSQQIALGLVGLAMVLRAAVTGWPAGRQVLREETRTKSSVPEQQLEPANVLFTSIWFGLLTGLGEAAILGIQRFVLRSYSPSLNPHAFWMVPLADLVLFTILGLLLLLVVVRWPRQVTLRFAVLAFGCVGFSGLVLTLQVQVQRWAALVLAVGLAAQTSRLIAARAGRFYSLARGTVPGMLSIVAVLGLCVYLWRVFPEDRAPAQLLPASGKAPNVLLIVLDTVRAQSLSLYGYSRPTTPRLERFADTGVRFERALSTSPWTLPSHGSMFTGYYPHQLFAGGQTPQDFRTRLDGARPTLAEMLAAHGYRTAGFVANLVYGTYEHGLDRGFAYYEDYLLSFSAVHSSSLGYMIYWIYKKMTGHKQPPGRNTAADVNRAFLKWLERHDSRPFFVFLNYFDAHDPYIAPEVNLTFAFKKPGDPYVVVPHDYTPEQMKEFQDAYDSCIVYLDHQIGLLLDQLKVQGVLDNTVVIITSDHGEQFGEHGLMTHGNSLYRQLLHVPLLISFPSRVPPGRIVGNPVSLSDLPATVVDLLGLRGDVRFPGTSLSRYWNGARSQADIATETHLSEELVGNEKLEWWPESWPISKGGMKSLVARGFHYIRNGDGREELYDFDNDPLEKSDLAGTEKGNQLIELMRESLRDKYGF